MNISIILMGLIVVSALTSLTTEGIKKMLDDVGKTYHSNILVGIVAVALSAAYGVCYVVLSGSAWTASLIIYLVCLVFLSWLGAMVGYDKVIQTISQFKEDE